jgi:hypothetical protein
LHESASISQNNESAMVLMNLLGFSGLRFYGWKCYGVPQNMFLARRRKGTAGLQLLDFEQNENFMAPL